MYHTVPNKPCDSEAPTEGWERDVCCKQTEYSLNRFPSDLRHDGALPPKVLIAETEEVVDYESCKDRLTRSKP